MGGDGGRREGEVFEAGALVEVHVEEVEDEAKESRSQAIAQTPDPRDHALSHSCEMSLLVEWVFVGRVVGEVMIVLVISINTNKNNRSFSIYNNYLVDLPTHARTRMR